MSTYIEITQVRSTIGRPESQRQIIKGLGLGKLHRTVRLKDTPAARGMVEKVQHLVTVKVFEGEAPLFGRRARS
ncbi:MAG: 50S ribosomal protein L30 [Myxococcota bacterium]